MREKHKGSKPRSARQILRHRLGEAEATLAAIRLGEVDAVVIAGPGGDRVLTMEGATHPYHVLLNAMMEGAALLTLDGTILFNNRRLGEIMRAPKGSLYGSRLQHLVVAAERSACEDSLRAAAERGCSGEFVLIGGDGTATPVLMALSAVPVTFYSESVATSQHDNTPILIAIVTDLTERKQAEATRFRLMSRVISAEDDERRRIARELHDETGQSLTALLVGLRTIDNVATITDARSLALRLSGIASQTLQNVGRLARGLHPSALDDMGLAAAAQRYVNDFGQSFPIRADFVANGMDSRRLSVLLESTMYRVLQEALTNVARHARAKRVSVELSCDGSMLELTVTDDGVGFDVPEALDRKSRLGLRGVHERVALLGGSVDFDSEPGRGTTVHASISAGAAVAAKPLPGRGGRRRVPRRESR